jgi:hypothetical protein
LALLPNWNHELRQLLAAGKRLGGRCPSNFH